LFLFFNKVWRYFVCFSMLCLIVANSLSWASCCGFPLRLSVSRLLLARVRRSMGWRTRVFVRWLMKRFGFPFYFCPLGFKFPFCYIYIIALLPLPISSRLVFYLWQPFLTALHLLVYLQALPGMTRFLPFLFFLPCLLYDGSFFGVVLLVAGTLLRPFTRPLDRFLSPCVRVITTSFLFHREKITSDLGYGSFVQVYFHGVDPWV
jgi:hypothetical protein